MENIITPPSEKKEATPENGPQPGTIRIISKEEEENDDSIFVGDEYIEQDEYLGGRPAPKG